MAIRKPSTRSAGSKPATPTRRTSRTRTAKHEVEGASTEESVKVSRRGSGTRSASSRARSSGKGQSDADLISLEHGGKKILGLTKGSTLTDFVAISIKEYGTEVIEQRAIPDFRDGLKPVHRCSLWSLYKLGINSSSGFKKSARTVGECIGKWHPHGDQSSYQAMVGLAGTKFKKNPDVWANRNCSTPLVEGSGNWGDFIDPAAAYRYCFDGNTRVMTNKGLIRIVDMPGAYGHNVNVEEPGLQVDFAPGTSVDSLTDAMDASHWINSGVRDVYEVTTSHGYKTICTSNEPLYVLNEYLEHEWVEVSNLKKGSFVSIKRGTRCNTPAMGLPLPEFEFKGNERSKVYPVPTNMSLDLAKVLGYLVGDGYINHDYVIGFNNVSDEVFEDFIASFDSAFPGVPFNVQVRDPNSYGVQPYNQFDCNSAYIVEFFASLGLFTGNSHDRCVPEVIFRSSRDEVAAFLSTLFESDGSAVGKTISYMSMSDTLLNDLKLVLLNFFGIITSRICAGHKIYILNYRNLRKFMRHIGFISKRKNKTMLKGLRNFSLSNTNSKTDQIPYVKEFSESFNSDYKVSPRYALTESGDEIFLNNQGGWISTRSLKSDSLRFRRAYRDKYRNSDFLQDSYPSTHKTLSDLYEADYLYDEVVSIRKLKRKRFVYDLTVPGTHAFVANGFVAHNTECRLSKFSDLYMLDPDYLAVMDYVRNYDDSDEMPLILPAKLPVVLLNGFSSIAVGVSASSPPFELEGVRELTKIALRGEKVLYKHCLQHLKFDYPYGGVCLGSREELLAIFKGKGSVKFIPSYEVDEDKRTLTFTSVCPGLMSSKSTETFLEKIARLKGIASVDDFTDKYGVRYVVAAQRTVKGPAFTALVDSILQIAARAESYDVGITIRDIKGSASFKRVTIPELVTMWAEWRIEVELKVINRLIGIQEGKKKRLEMMVLAVDNLETIIKALKVKEDKITVNINGVATEVDASAGYLMKQLKIDLDTANQILDLKVRQLRSLEKKKLLESIKAIVATIKGLQADLKAPNGRILQDLDSLAKVKL